MRKLPADDSAERRAPLGKRFVNTNRRGALLVWFALMLTMLLGMVGLVIDGGILMAAHRHAQNAADAASMAAAKDLMRGKTKDQATATAIDFVKSHDDLSEDPDPTVNIPPVVSAHYAGLSRYVEVIVAHPVQTYFIHILGLAPQHSVSARAVAGYESLSADEGVFALDPDGKPGLQVSGGARLIVNGGVVVNSESGGVDENGESLDFTSGGVAAKVTNNSQLLATDIRVVGGVNDPNNFQSYDPESEVDVLHCGQTPEPDPLAELATPDVNNGVDPTPRGAPKATDGELQLNADPNESGYLNRIVTDPDLGEVMLLHPGIYESITITGGNVRFVPGFYVLRPSKSTPYILTITGGNVEAEGVMFYNTGSDYQPDGTPDVYDQTSSPPSTDGVDFGGVKINAAMRLQPLRQPVDYSQFDYQPPVAVSKEFDGMLFYQRRQSETSIHIEGNSSEGNLGGTLYAKRGDVQIAGQGTYDAQFVVGTMKITGSGDVTIDFAGPSLGKAPRVFLVE